MEECIESKIIESHCLGVTEGRAYDLVYLCKVLLLGH